jgi:hypothetical protein
LINKIRSLQNKPIPVPSPSSPRSLTPSSSAGAIGRLSTDPKKNKKERKDSKKVKGKITEDAGSQIQPEESLKQLQIHKNNLFEVSLPNRVTKIIEARPHCTIREAITHVLKKYNYSLDVMEVKLTNTLQPVDVDAPAAILIGKHVSITRSKHTVTVTFPDGPDAILPADGSTTLRLLLDKTLADRGKVNSYSVYLEGARAPLELNVSTSNLEGHVITIKYNPSSTVPSSTSSIPSKKTIFNLSSESGSSIGSSNSGKLSDGVEELFTMIARLNSDTLLDQRTSEEQQQQQPSTVLISSSSLSDPMMISSGLALWVKASISAVASLLLMKLIV